MLDPRIAIDGLLELTVIPSFSRIGPVVRRRLFDWDSTVAVSLTGKTTLITGPTSGLGHATADAFARLGARVILVGRDAGRLEAVRRELTDRYGGERGHSVVAADIGSLAEVRAAVDAILATEARLDVLVDNAGAIEPERRDGPDGIEATVALMVVGPFALIGGLAPLLRRTRHSRVISVVSGGMYLTPLALDDLQSTRGHFSGTRAYAQAKRASTALIREWGRRSAPGTVTFSAMHPGWTDTPGLAHSLPRFYRLMRRLLRTPAEGVDTIVWLATQPDPARSSGRLFLDRRSRPFDRVRSTRLSATERRRLWDEVVRLSGSPDPTPELG